MNSRQMAKALSLVLTFTGSLQAYSPAPIPDLNFTNLHKAASGCDVKEAEKALKGLKPSERKACLDRIDREGYSPLGYAASGGCLEIATRLIKAGASVDAKDPYRRWTPLMEAAQGQHAEVVRLLLAHGADVNAASANGKTSWTLAVRGPLMGDASVKNRNDTLLALLEKDVRIPEGDDAARAENKVLREERRVMLDEMARLRHEVQEMQNQLNGIRDRLGDGTTRPN